MGVEPLRSRRAAARAAAVLPLPGFLRRRFTASQSTPPPAPDTGTLATLVAPTAHVGAAVVERAAALVAAVAIAGAGGAVLGGSPAHQRSATPAGHHREAAPATHRSRAGETSRHSTNRAGQPAARRRDDWRSRAGSDATPRGGKKRDQTPAAGKGATGSGLAAPGSIEPPEAPGVPSAPPVRLTPPARPDLPAPPAAAASAPVTVQGPSEPPDVLGGLGAAGG